MESAKLHQNGGSQYFLVFLHIFSSTLVVWASSAFLAGAVYRFSTLAEIRMSATNLYEFFLKNIAMFTVISGVILGFMNNLRFPHSSAFWAPLLPAAISIYKIAFWHDYSVLDSRWNAVKEHFFSVCSIDCIDQVAYTGPLLCSFGYMVGAACGRYFREYFERHPISLRRE